MKKGFNSKRMLPIFPNAKDKKNMERPKNLHGNWTNLISGSDSQINSDLGCAKNAVNKNRVISEIGRITSLYFLFPNPKIAIPITINPKNQCGQPI